MCLLFSRHQRVLPINLGPKLGLVMPSYGEDGARGFFLRGLGYYFILGQHMDLAIQGGIYTLGSWEVSASSRYNKRYKCLGQLHVRLFLSVKTGDQGRAGLHKAEQLQVHVDAFARPEG